MHPSCDIEQVYLCRVPVDFREWVRSTGQHDLREFQIMSELPTLFKPACVLLASPARVCAPA